MSYGGWILKEEEFQETNFVKILQLTLHTNHLEVHIASAYSFLSLIYSASMKTSVFLLI